MPASVFISPVLFRHTGGESWLMVGVSGVLQAFSVLAFNTHYHNAHIQLINLPCTKGAHVYSKYTSLAHYCDKSILQACCQLERLGSWSANFEDNQFNIACYISRWSGNGPQGDEKPAELLLTIRQNCCLHVAFAWAKAFWCTGPSPSVLPLQEVSRMTACHLTTLTLWLCLLGVCHCCTLGYIWELIFPPVNHKYFYGL